LLSRDGVCMINSRVYRNRRIRRSTGALYHRCRVHGVRQPFDRYQRLIRKLGAIATVYLRWMRGSHISHQPVCNPSSQMQSTVRPGLTFFLTASPSPP
jgi:hypothetical protein